MLWLVVVAGLYMFRGRIAEKLAPFMPSMSPQRSSFFGNVLALAAALIFVVPLELLGLGGVKRMAFMASLWITIVTCGKNIQANYGSPPMPQTMSMAAIKQMITTTIQPWMTQACQSVDFHFLFFALIFVMATPSIFPLLILSRRSLWAVGSHCTKTPADGGVLWLKFKPTWDKLKAQEPQILHTATMAEILLAFWLTVSLLLPTRQILACILYWNFLKTRFAMPRSAAAHQKAWMEIGSKFDPVLKMAPFLQKPIDMAKDWFRPRYA